MFARMEPHYDARDSLSPTCTFTFFECLSRQEPDMQHFRASRHSDSERGLRVIYQQPQPHLVPPMKLTVYDDLPATPLPPSPSHLSQLMSQGRDLASRASARASLSIRRKPSRPVISNPQPIPRHPEDLPFRRQQYRPLELSIYMPNNRLSDLPEFDTLSFTEVGEIKVPPRALLRTKSEEVLQTRALFMTPPRKPASMFEGRRKSHTRHDTSSTAISTSRPPSEYDALHSHPVSWASLPGLPPQVHMNHRPDNSIAILSPMQEESTPPATAVTIGETLLKFPNIAPPQEDSSTQNGPLPAAHAPAPSPCIAVGCLQRPETSVDAESNRAASYFHTNYQTQKRISQWLAARSHSSSISTTRSGSTSASFAEHRRKRSQFYQLSSQAPPPQPIHIRHPSHARTATVSTIASTVDTDIMFFDSLNQSQASMTTAPTLATTDSQSRSGIIKSVGTGVGNIFNTGLKPIVSGVPDLPPHYAELVENVGVILGKCDEEVVIREINGPLRSPGVGLAF